MCGLVTIVSKQKNGIFHGDMKIFTEMLFADQLRGGDGTGIFYNKGKELKVLKAPIGSSDFVNDALYHKATVEIIKSGNFVVGHNRSATKGKLSYANTHPFREKHITLVHNGTLHYHKELADTEVDSHAICISIADRGIKETLKKIYGAYALIWFDNKQKTLNFIRNSQRPLFIVETANLFILISEKKLAEWILDRNKEYIISTKEVPINTLHQFEVGNWKKYETEYINSFQSQFPNQGYVPQSSPGNKIVPFTEKKDYIDDKNINIGSKISFVPMSVDKDLGVKLIGAYKNKQTGETIEVKYWTRTIEDAENYLKVPVLSGIISHISYKPSSSTKSYIMKDIEIPENKSLGLSFNERPVTEADLDSLGDGCSCCTVTHSKTFIKAHLKECIIEEDKHKANKLIYTCPDCTDWLQNNSGMNQYGGH